MANIALLGVRGAQIIFAAVVLGLAVSLLKGSSNAPATLGFAAFTGGFAILTAFAGIAVALLDNFVLPMVGLDLFTVLLYLAGAIAYVVKIGHVNCERKENDRDTQFNNQIITGGCTGQHFDVHKCSWVFKNGKASTSHLYSELQGRCRMAMADMSFQWITFAVLCGAVFLGFMAHRKR